MPNVADRISRSRAFQRSIDEGHKILNASMEKHDIVQVYACMSGGGDSLASTRLAMEHFPNAKVLHVNTGIGVERTRDFVRETCAREGWPLVELHAKEDCGQDYEKLIMDWGFPGPAHHGKMYDRLKGRAMAKALRDAKEGHSRFSRVLFVSGVRAAESRIRAGYKRVENRVGSQVWVNPLYNWHGFRCENFLDYHRMPRNEVSFTLGMSGECLCGAFADPGEMNLVRRTCKDTYRELCRLEEKHIASGKPWRWEDEGPPRTYLLERDGGQLPLFQPMCAGCGKSK